MANDSINIENLINIRFKNRTASILQKNSLTISISTRKIQKNQKRQLKKLLISTLFLNIFLLTVIVSNLTSIMFFTIIADMSIFEQSTNSVDFYHYQSTKNCFSISRVFIFRIKRKTIIVRRTRFHCYYYYSFLKFEYSLTFSSLFKKIN